MTHTPTPWRLGEVSNEYQSIVCDDNANSVTIWLANADARGNVAAHIVKCVNLHDELVAMVEKLKGYIPAMYVAQGHPLLREANTLIAKARGEA